MTKDTFIEMKGIFENTLKKLSGRDKRIFAGELAMQMGRGGQSVASKELGISAPTLRKAIREIKTGEAIEDNFKARGRKKAEEKLPQLMEDIESIIDSQSQADPDFKTQRLYTRMTTQEVRKQLILQKGYTDEELPTSRSLNSKINKLGYTLKKVQKTKPIKKNKGNRSNI